MWKSGWFRGSAGLQACSCFFIVCRLFFDVFFCVFEGSDSFVRAWFDPHVVPVAHGGSRT